MKKARPLVLAAVAMLLAAVALQAGVERSLAEEAEEVKVLATKIADCPSGCVGVQKCPVCG